MKVMTIDEGAHWLHSAHIQPYHEGKLRFSTPTTTFRTPKDSGAKTALARLIIHEIFANKATILILEETGVWESSENPFLFFKYREVVSHDQNARREPFDDYPFHYAEADEASAMEGLIALALYFIWEVTIFDGEGETFIRVSHDEWIEIGSSSTTKYNDAITLFDSFGLVLMS